MQGENHPTREVPVEFESRLFPAMLGEHCGMFNFQECRFHVKVWGCRGVGGVRV
jgi:hypothetical protein